MQMNQGLIKRHSKYNAQNIYYPFNVLNVLLMYLVSENTCVLPTQNYTDFPVKCK